MSSYPSYWGGAAGGARDPCWCWGLEVEAVPTRREVDVGHTCCPCHADVTFMVGPFVSCVACVSTSFPVRGLESLFVRSRTNARAPHARSRHVETWSSRLLSREVTWFPRLSCRRHADALTSTRKHLCTRLRTHAPTAGYPRDYATALNQLDYILWQPTSLY